MKRPCALLLLVVACAVPTTMCSCTEMGCQDHMSFVLENAGDAYATRLPVAIEVCVELGCATHDLYEENGEMKCSSVELDHCYLDEDGDLRIDFTGGFQSTPTAKISVTDEGGATLLEESHEVVTTEYRPNGSLSQPVCHSGTAEFVAKQPGG